MQASNRSNQNIDLSQASSRMLQCPYNSKHLLEPRCFPLHLQKCRKKLPPHILKNFVVCRFNSLHICSVYEIGAHEINCPNKKNMIDLEQKLLENPKIMAEEISQVSQYSQHTIKQHNTAHENQHHIQQLPNKNAQLQSNQNATEVFFNPSKQFSQNKTQMRVIMNPKIQEVNYLDDGSKNTSEEQENFNASPQLSQTKKNIEESQQLLCYNIPKQERQRQQLKNWRQQKQYKEQHKKIAYLQNNSKCKETYNIKNQIPQQKYKISAVNYLSQKLSSVQNSNRNKHSSSLDLSKHITYKPIEIKKENPSQQLYNLQQKNFLFIPNKQKLTNNEQIKIFQKLLNFKNYQQISFHQCKQCGDILCNPDNRLWKNKKLLKYLKAYQKLQEEGQEIQEFLKYIPKYLKKQSQSSKQIPPKLSQKQDIKQIKPQHHQNHQQKYFQQKTKATTQNTYLITDQIKKQSSPIKYTNSSSPKLVINNHHGYQDKKGKNNKIIKQEVNKNDVSVEVNTNRSNRATSEMNERYSLKCLGSGNKIKIQQNSFKQLPNEKRMTLDCLNKKQVIQLDSFQQLDSQLGKE